MKGIGKMRYKNNVKPKRDHTKTGERFSIHDLYPEDDYYDREAFNEDPDHYVFTKDDVEYFNAMELQDYENKVPMTPDEKRALRNWVKDGHSVNEMPPSKYPCVHCRYPAPDFLEVYRTDRKLDAATKGMSDDEVMAYIADLYGFHVESEEEKKARSEKDRLHEQTPQEIREKIRILQRKLSYTWLYIMEEGLYDEANEYVKAHMDEPLPFEDVW